uniref:Mitochondrial nucleoid factor 1 n=1 Tax=Timema genevievae TaxID=629358 RepID=A0A7R9PHC4_TIMGE|nr:unnamed protein product [Timema genevievae]
MEPFIQASTFVSLCWLDSNGGNPIPSIKAEFVASVLLNLNRSSSNYVIDILKDLGEYIREQVKLGFSAGAVTKANDAECERIHASLKRLVDNHYSQLYKRVLSSSSSGLSVSECHSILTTEFLEKLEEEDKSFVSKLFDKKEK